MKKLILGFLLVSLSAKGQFTKGDFYLGGAISVGSTNTFTPNIGGFPNGTTGANRSISFLPTMGFFQTEHAVWGFTLGYTFSDVNNKSNSPFGNTSDNNSITYSASTFIRRFIPISDKFMFTIGWNMLSFSRGNVTIISSIGGTPGKSENSFYTVGTSVYPTFVFFPSSNWGFEVGFSGLSYTYTRILPDNGDQHTINLALAQNLTVGVSHYFRKPLQ